MVLDLILLVVVLAPVLFGRRTGLVWITYVGIVMGWAVIVILSVRLLGDLLGNANASVVELVGQSLRLIIFILVFLLITSGNRFYDQ